MHILSISAITSALCTAYTMQPNPGNVYYTFYPELMRCK